MYANELIVPSGATLNLNGLHMYVRGMQVSGTIVGGTVTQVPGGGPLAVNTPAASDLSAVSAVDKWTFFARSGETISLEVNPSDSGTLPALDPAIGAVQVELLDPAGVVVAQGTSNYQGAVTLPGISLGVNGVYTLQVEALSGTKVTGNYTVAVYDVTPNITPLVLGQEQIGKLTGAFGIDQYDFSASANEQVEFQLLGASQGVVFSLTGPGGYKAFSGARPARG